MTSAVRQKLAAAVTDHARWIVDLSECLERHAGGSPRQCRKFLGQIGAEDACSLGHWLLEQEAKPGSPHYRAVRELHRQFHEVASEVVALALAGKAVGAASLLEETLCPLSRRLVAALDAWAADEAA